MQSKFVVPGRFNNHLVDKISVHGLSPERISAASRRLCT